MAASKVTKIAAWQFFVILISIFDDLSHSRWYERTSTLVRL